MLYDPSNSKRIAKNTLMLYFRMFLIMAITLYTSRVILKTLGIVDYGIYNVVGGVVTLFTIITGSLSITVSRYITFELGKGETERLSKVFSTSVIIQIVMALFICVIAEMAGVWFLNAKMNLPMERLYAANWVLQCSIATFMINLVSVPYNAAIIAHEKMSAFAYISILEVVLKLAIVYMLTVIAFDKLIVYALLQMCVAATMRFLYGAYCNKHFSEVRFKFILDWKLIKEMFGLISWAFWGNGAIVLRDQGSNMILNLFCGPAINAARGVALQINTAVYNFTSNFLTAIKPQITKSYASGDLHYMHTLQIKGSKYGFFILLILVMPLCANINYLLSLWLVEVPAHTASFIILTVIYSLFDCFSNPLVMGALAQGNIRNYEIILLILCVLNFFSSYLCLKFGFLPEWVFIMNIIYKVFIVCTLVWHSNKKHAFPIRMFCRQTVLRCLAVSCICCVFVWVLKIDVGKAFVNCVLSCLCIFFFSILSICFIGLSRKERMYGVSLLKSKIKLRK